MIRLLFWLIHYVKIITLLLSPKAVLTRFKVKVI